MLALIDGVVTRRHANQYTAFRFVSDTHKECSDCSEIKLHSEFHKDKQNKFARGLAYYCKVCACARGKGWHKRNEGNLEYKLRKKNTHIQVTYGISLAEYTDRIAKQKHCAICGEVLKGVGTFTHLDHCHTTGKLRDFLCSSCNRGLGCFFDSPSILQKAIKYLQKHNSSDCLNKEDICL